MISTGARGISQASAVNSDVALEVSSRVTTGTEVNLV